MQSIWRHRFGICLLLLTATTCSAQEARNPDYDYTPGYGTIKWPERRQHLLAGRYTGKIQVQVNRGACPSANADLRLEAIKGSQDSRHYTLTYTCLSGTDPDYRKKTVTLRSTWGIDEIAGSCLILQREPDPTLNPPLYYPLYGFRIHENDSPGAGHGIVLSQDGSDCESGGASEYLDKKLKRVR